MVNCKLAGFAAGNDQVIPTVSIYIEPRDTGTELTEFVRQERLASKVIERFIDVRVGQQRRNIFELTVAGGFGFVVGKGRGWRTGWWLINFVNGVGLGIRDDAVSAR